MNASTRIALGFFGVSAAAVNKGAAIGCPFLRESMALNRYADSHPPTAGRQAIFLGATEPTRCPTGKESAAGVMLVGQGGLPVSISSVIRACSRRIRRSSLHARLEQSEDADVSALIAQNRSTSLSGPLRRFVQKMHFVR
jgi:hypothetical protein